MQPEHYNRSAEHWRRNILKTGTVNSVPTDKGQGATYQSKPPSPQPGNMITPTSKTENYRVLASLIAFVIWNIGMMVPTIAGTNPMLQQFSVLDNSVYLAIGFTLVGAMWVAHMANSNHAFIIFFIGLALLATWYYGV